MLPKSKPGSRSEGHAYSSHRPEHGWGIQRKEPKFRVETGALIPTGRIIHITGGNVLARSKEHGNAWRGVKP